MSRNGSPIALRDEPGLERLAVELRRAGRVPRRRHRHLQRHRVQAPDRQQQVRQQRHVGRRRAGRSGVGIQRAPAVGDVDVPAGRVGGERLDPELVEERADVVLRGPDELRPEVDRLAAHGAVEHPPADAVTRLDDGDRVPGARDRPRGDEPRQPRADDDDVVLAVRAAPSLDRLALRPLRRTGRAARRGERRRPRGTGDETTAADAGLIAHACTITPAPAAVKRERSHMPRADARQSSATPMSDADPTAIFHEMYGAAVRGGPGLPWDREGPHPLLEPWARDLDGAGRRALVVGSGLGTDAEFIAGRGFRVVGFDVSPTAIDMARERFPTRRRLSRRQPARPARRMDARLRSRRRDLHRAVDADRAPRARHREHRTDRRRRRNALVIATGRRNPDVIPDGPPFPLTRAEVEAFAADGLQAEHVEAITDPGGDDPPRWRATFRRHP